jgi:tagatose 1,6-diphosphate aldolase
MAISIGTLRGLQQIANDRGIFTMTAMDQRGALKSMLSPGGDVPYATMRQVKVEVVGALAPHSSAMLIDPEYGAAECIAEGALPGRCGLIVSIEETGYTPDGSGRLTKLIPDWGVARIKRMGASAVKLLVYYQPEEKDAARFQRDVVSRVAEDCRKYDIPLLVEAVTYPASGQDKAAFAASKPEAVIRTAEELAPLGFDVYKAEFPVDLAFPHDPNSLDEWCRKLDAACPMPWVILSAGVDIDQFVQQVEIACRNGASGFLAGRAIWKDSVKIADPAERREHLRTAAVANLQRCVNLAEQHARPWRDKLGRAQGFGDMVQEGWLSRYDAM